MHVTIEGVKTTPNSGRGWGSRTEDVLGDIYGALPFTIPPLCGWATWSWAVMFWASLLVSVLLPAFAVRTFVVAVRVVMWVVSRVV